LSKLIYPIKYSRGRNTNSLSDMAIRNPILDDSLYRITKCCVRRTLSL